jgi:hypothetical protein
MTTLVCDDGVYGKRYFGWWDGFFMELMDKTNDQKANQTQGLSCGSHLGYLFKIHCTLPTYDVIIPMYLNTGNNTYVCDIGILLDQVPYVPLGG